MSQTQDILRALKQGERLTPLDALKRFGCFRLTSRIWDIKQMGYDVRTETIEVGDDGKHVSCYWLADPVPDNHEEDKFINKCVPLGTNIFLTF